METSILFYENLTVIFGIAGVVMLFVSFILYIIFDIKQIISKRLGFTEKKALRQMQIAAKLAERKAENKRQSKLRTAKLMLRQRAANLEAHASGHSKKDRKPLVQARFHNTEEIAPDGLEMKEAADTVVLNEEMKTSVLSKNSSLNRNENFILVKHIMLIHTDEVIE